MNLIACGGTALTLLGVKPSTKDIDLMMPNIDEYEYLLRTIKELGYKAITGWGWARDEGFVFDLFRGNKIHTTELLESPLMKDNHILLKEFSHIYLGVLNYYDLIISKLFRGTLVDIDDCLMLLKAKRNEINIHHLKERYKETAKYEIAQNKVIKYLENFIERLKKERLV